MDTFNSANIRFALRFLSLLPGSSRCAHTKTVAHAYRLPRIHFEYSRILRQSLSNIATLRQVAAAVLWPLAGGPRPGRDVKAAEAGMLSPGKPVIVAFEGQEVHPHILSAAAVKLLRVAVTALGKS